MRTIIKNNTVKNRIDQVSKLYITTHFILGEQIEVFSWFRIHFIENEGMAWGTEIPGAYGKLILTIFRLLEPYGYYEFEFFDNDGWPHYKVKEELPALKAGEQSVLMKEAIVNYFLEKEVIE